MPDAEDALKIEVVPWGPTQNAVHEAGAAALEHSAVRAELVGTDHMVLSIAPVAPAAGAEADVGPESGLVRTTIYDYTNQRTLLVDAPLDGSQPVAVRSSTKQPLPGVAELKTAVEAIMRDPELGRELGAGRLEPYRPMPPFAFEEQPDGRVERMITVGLRSPGTSQVNEIVAVKPTSGAVTRFATGAPPASRAADAQCGLPDASQPTAAFGTAGQVKVTVKQAGHVLWSFIAVRPAASSGTGGSGIELRSVVYRGKRVLRRAHVPILNVRYDQDACGPFRDWQWEEGMIEADGDDVAPGFRLCHTPARTILDSGSDAGNFLGVAIYVQGDEVVLVSELEAGWYRYISQWRLHANGTIRPRFGFGAVQNSCVCTVHHHHVYWRLDFDVASAAHNDVLEFNDPPVVGATNWHTLRHEVRRSRNPAHKRAWQVANRSTGESYTLIPGAGDGVADSFGVGDLWALRRRGGQIDDGQGFTTDPVLARARLDQFVNGESIHDADVVLWYAAHFTHDLHEDEAGHIVGPELVPGHW